jgi:hypothetical protein
MWGWELWPLPNGKWCPEEEAIITSNNLILFFKENSIFLRGTSGGTEKIILSGSLPDLSSIHTVPIHFFPFHGKPNRLVSLGAIWTGRRHCHHLFAVG